MDDSRSQSLFFRLALFIVPLAVTGLVAVSVYVPRAVEQTAVSDALLKAEETVKKFKILRKYYSENVIAALAGNKQVSSSAAHTGVENVIPSPATLIHELSDESPPRIHCPGWAPLAGRPWPGAHKHYRCSVFKLISKILA